MFIDYKQKYLKYKTKYQNLSNLNYNDGINHYNGQYGGAGDVGDLKAALVKVDKEHLAGKKLLMDAKSVDTASDHTDDWNEYWRKKGTTIDKAHNE